MEVFSASGNICLEANTSLARSGLAGPKELAQQFRKVTPAKLAPILETLAALGQIRHANSGRYVA